MLIPLSQSGVSTGRRGGGFSLAALERVRFDHEERTWEQPAAAIECTESDLLGPFLVLVADVAERLSLGEKAVTWREVVACLDEWQVLLSRRESMTLERQLGLWGELWLISRATNPDTAIEAWRGPDGDAMDFFWDGLSVEVKASRQCHVHHVSQTQTESPVGEFESYLLSLWVSVDPVRGKSLSELVDTVCANVQDPAVALKRIMFAGYIPADRALYNTRFRLLERPLWFRTIDVPRVRSVDPGVSRLRYVATLQTDLCLDEAVTDGLWRRSRVVPVDVLEQSEAK
jgi:hypothetical protein